MIEGAATNEESKKTMGAPSHKGSPTPNFATGGSVTVTGKEVKGLTQPILVIT